MNEKLIKLRKEIKAKKPKFIRQESKKKSKVKPCWRRPKGLHSKLRLGKKGYGKKIAVGYKSPAEVKGLSREGLVVVIVSNPSDISKLSKGGAALISKNVGQRKKVEIAAKAKELGITIMNIKNVDAYLKSVSESMQKKKEEKKKGVQEKEKKKEEKEKKAKEKKKEDLAEKLTEEERKEKEKKEKDKLLTKKGT